ncbi:hypothetical protein ACF053_02460 [Streptomyces kanasensis]|uniref:hypothetical protein n=1 Tax=Streptomyces kanasensis TaxID=936756 RepID=UPI0037019754
MIVGAGKTGAPRRPWGPRRVARATMVWAVLYAGFGLACALSGTPPLHLGSDPGPSALGWGVAGVGALAALTCGAVTRYGPRPATRVLLWVLCVPAGTAAFGLLMDVITLVFGQGVDNGVAAAHHALAAAGVLLLAATARSRPVRRVPDAAVARAPSAASGPVQLAACAGTMAFLPYAAMKLVWASGGTFAGMTGEEMRAVSRRNGASGAWLTLESWGLDATVLLAALGTFLLWGLVRPWGQVFPRWTLWLRDRRVPRWLLLAPALTGAATLAPYGVFGVGYVALATAGVVTIRRGDFHSSSDALLVAWIGMTAFAVYGAALTVAARSYWLRTPSRPTRSTAAVHAAPRPEQ